MGYTPHVVVIGGGAVGAGIARDLAIRGLDVTLVERGRLASGTTGRMRGLLVSGAQFAASNPRVAQQCLAENRTLFEIASHCIEDTDGLVVQHADDDPEQFDRLKQACEECGIASTELSGERARELEPALTDSVERALRVPDAAIDPFQITVATARDAREYGAEIRTNTTVTDIVVEDGSVTAVEVQHDPKPRNHVEEVDPEDDADDTAVDDDADDEQADGDDADDEQEQADDDEEEQADGDDGDDSPARGELRRKKKSKLAGQTTSGQIPGSTGESDETEPEPETTTEDIEADYVVNAAGAWAERVAGLAALSLPLAQSHEPVVVTADRHVDTAVTRLSGDTIAPYGTHSVLAEETTLAVDDTPPDAVPPGAVDGTLDSLGTVVDGVESGRPLRSYSGIRYTVSGHDRPGASGHGFVLVDHADQHDCWGMTTVLGGSVTTHRLAAERAADDVCRKFGISRESQTDELPLPGSEDEPFPESEASTATGEMPASTVSTDGRPVVCECQSVTAGEVRTAVADPSSADTDLSAVRTRTSAAMGACQGGHCAHRLAEPLSPEYDEETIENAVRDLLAERWRGQRTAVRGEELSQAARNYRLQAATMNRKHPRLASPNIEAFDGGQAQRLTRRADERDLLDEGWQLGQRHLRTDDGHQYSMRGGR